MTVGDRGIKKVVAKSFFFCGGFGPTTLDQSLARWWQGKHQLNKVVWGGLMKKARSKLVDAIPATNDLFPMIAGSMIVSGVASGHHLDCSATTMHPEVLLSLDYTIQDCHLSSLICSDDYRLGPCAGIAQWDALH